MKIQINEKEDIVSGFKRGQLLAGNKGGIYLCSNDQTGNTVDVVTIKPENAFETEGYPMDSCHIENFKLFNGEITLSND